MKKDDDLGEQLLDLFVYAPIGLLLEARELIPKLADRGRGQVALAQVARKFASSASRHAGAAAADEPDEPEDHGEDAQSGSDAGPVDGASLAIADYDSYTAAQLLSKLETLSAAQLTEILAYEKAHRNRQTVSNKIKKLIAANDSSRE